MISEKPNKQYFLKLYIFISYIDTDEIPGFLLLLKIRSLVRTVKIQFLSFTCEDIGVVMVFCYFENE